MNLYETYRPETFNDVIGQPIAAYVALARKHKYNMRAMLQTIESGEMLE